MARGAEDVGHHRGGHRGDAAALGKSLSFVALCSDLLTRINEQVEAEEYLAVFFTGPCEERAKTDQVGSTGTAGAHCPNVACEILMFQFWNTY